MPDDLLLFSIRESTGSIEEYLRDGRSFFFSDKKARDGTPELRGAISPGSATWSFMTTCRWTSR
jgi:hypothetical protein